MPATLGYWAIRGLGQPIRLLLKFCEEDFIEKKFHAGGSPDYSREEWLQYKQMRKNEGFVQINLPFYEDGDVKLSQTNAILRYIARKHNLCGKTLEEQCRVDQMADYVMDLRNDLIRLCYNPISDAKKEKYIENLPSKFEMFEKFLGDNPFLAGKEVTFPDFHLYEMLDEHMILFPGCLDKFPKLKAYQDRFENLPAIQRYMKSAEFMKAPLNNTMASLGN